MVKYRKNTKDLVELIKTFDNIPLFFINLINNRYRIKRDLSEKRKIIYKTIVLEMLENGLINYTESTIDTIIEKFERILNENDKRKYFTEKELKVIMEYYNDLQKNGKRNVSRKILDILSKMKEIYIVEFNFSEFSEKFNKLGGINDTDRGTLLKNFKKFLIGKEFKDRINNDKIDDARANISIWRVIIKEAITIFFQPIINNFDQISIETLKKLLVDNIIIKKLIERKERYDFSIGRDVAIYRLNTLSILKGEMKKELMETISSINNKSMKMSLIPIKLMQDIHYFEFFVEFFSVSDFWESFLIFLVKNINKLDKHIFHKIVDLKFRNSEIIDAYHRNDLSINSFFNLLEEYRKEINELERLLNNRRNPERFRFPRNILIEFDEFINYYRGLLGEEDIISEQFNHPDLRYNVEAANLIVEFFECDLYKDYDKLPGFLDRITRIINQQINPEILPILELLKIYIKIMYDILTSETPLETGDLILARTADLIRNYQRKYARDPFAVKLNNFQNFIKYNIHLKNYEFIISNLQEITKHNIDDIQKLINNLDQALKSLLMLDPFFIEHKYKIGTALILMTEKYRYLATDGISKFLIEAYFNGKSYDYEILYNEVVPGILKNLVLGYVLFKISQDYEENFKIKIYEKIEWDTDEIEFAIVNTFCILAKYSFKEFNDAVLREELNKIFKGVGNFQLFKKSKNGDYPKDVIKFIDDFSIWFDKRVSEYNLRLFDMILTNFEKSLDETLFKGLFGNDNGDISINEDIDLLMKKFDELPIFQRFTNILFIKMQDAYSKTKVFENFMRDIINGKIEITKLRYKKSEDVNKDTIDNEKENNIDKNKNKKENDDKVKRKSK
ncbi:MAG: hypothetical protein ACTSPQ_13440 [Candidatus Helarchaeota archaeon]